MRTPVKRIGNAVMNAVPTPETRAVIVGLPMVWINVFAQDGYLEVEYRNHEAVIRPCSAAALLLHELRGPEEITAQTWRHKVTHRGLQYGIILRRAWARRVSSPDEMLWMCFDPFRNEFLIRGETLDGKLRASPAERADYPDTETPDRSTEDLQLAA